MRLLPSNIDLTRKGDFQEHQLIPRGLDPRFWIPAAHRFGNGIDHLRSRFSTRDTVFHSLSPRDLPSERASLSRKIFFPEHYPEEYRRAACACCGAPIPIPFEYLHLDYSYLFEICQRCDARTSSRFDPFFR